MWSAIKDILTSSNAVGVLLILGFLVIVLIVVAVVLFRCNLKNSGSKKGEKLCSI